MVADVATQQRVFFLFYIHFVLQEDMASMAADLASQQRVVDASQRSHNSKG